MMKTQSNYAAPDLAQARVPVAIVRSEHNEFIRREHAEHLARNIAGAEFVLLPGVPHLARPQQAQFNTEPFGFPRRVLP